MPKARAREVKPIGKVLKFTRHWDYPLRLKGKLERERLSYTYHWKGEGNDSVIAVAHEPARPETGGVI